MFKLEELKPHWNADTLSLIKIGDTDYTYVAKTTDWVDHVGKLVCWIPPDSLVNITLESFAFLAEEGKYDKDSNKVAGGVYARVKAKKIRGIVSYGLLIVVDDINNDDDLRTRLDIHHYEAPLTNNGGAKMTGGEVASPPSGNYPKYDVDAFLKYGRKVFTEGEAIYVTEKIHGANARYVCKDGTMYCGSRTEWKKEFASPPKLTVEDLIAKGMEPEKAAEIYEKKVVNFRSNKNMWWSVLSTTPSLENFLKNNDSHAVYGEVYGQVQNLKYGAKNGELWFAAFDILKPDGSWMHSEEFLNVCDMWDIPTVPVLHQKTSFEFDYLVNLASGDTLVPQAGKQIREGVVVKPVKERWDHKLGRVCLKIVSSEYLALK